MKLYPNKWKLMGLAVLFLAGCVVTPGPDPYYTSEAIIEAPPPPQVEVIGAAPYPDYVWINGYWTWQNHHHEWTPGRWQAPYAGHHWIQHSWDRDGQRWRERRGHWERN